MKAQIKVGEGDGNRPGIPGRTGAFNTYDYHREDITARFPRLVLTGLLLGTVGVVAFWWRRRQ